MNNQKLWFKAKRYGWGWTPCSWEGWLILVVFVMYIIWNSLQLDTTSSNIPYSFYGKTTLAIIILISICFKKGEKPSWRWGDK